ETAAGKVPTNDGASAARALSRIAPGTPLATAAVTALTAALKSESIATREAALGALEPFGPAAAAAIPSIRAVQEKDPIPNVRQAATSALEALENGAK